MKTTVSLEYYIDCVHLQQVSNLNTIKQGRIGDVYMNQTDYKQQGQLERHIGGVKTLHMLVKRGGSRTSPRLSITSAQIEMSTNPTNLNVIFIMKMLGVSCSLTFRCTHDTTIKRCFIQKQKKKRKKVLYEGQV